MDLKAILAMVKSVLLMLAPQLKKPDSSAGVQEISEALVGVNELAVYLAGALKDGFQLDDAMDLWKKLADDDEFKGKLSRAVDGLGHVSAEFKDVDAGEGLELACLQLDYLPKLLDAFKKEPQA